MNSLTLFTGIDGFTTMEVPAGRSERDRREILHWILGELLIDERRDRHQAEA
jgi:hypothetical protein